MTFAWDDRVQGMNDPQILATRGEHNVFFQTTTPALHACCSGLPGWLTLNSAAGAVMTLQMPTIVWLCCAGGIIGDDLDNMIWGQLMLLDTKLDVMWSTYIILGLDLSVEISKEQLITAIKAIGAAATGAYKEALTIRRAHFQLLSLDFGPSPPHAIVPTTLIDDEIQISGDEGWCKVGGSAEPLGEIELMVGKRYVVADRAAGTPYRRALESVVEYAGANGLPMEEAVVKVAEIWSEAIWPIGMHAAAVSLAIRRIEVSKRLWYYANPTEPWSRAIFTGKVKGVLSCTTAIKAALYDETSNIAVFEAVAFMAAAMKIVTNVPHSLFARVETYLMKLPADVGIRQADQDYTTWEAAVLSYIKQVTGAESATVKAMGESTSNGGGSTASSGKGPSKYLEFMTFVHCEQFLHMQEHMIAYRNTPGCDLGVLAEWAFTGKTPAEAMPNGEKEQTARRTKEANYGGLAIFHQVMWGKSDPSLVMPKLSFMSEARTEDVVSQRMATVAIRAYIGASEMHVALKTLQLKMLYKAFADPSKWDTINFSDDMDRVIVQQFNRITIKPLGMDVYKDCSLVQRAAPGAQAIVDFFGITEREGWSLQSNWARLRLAYMLHTNVSQQQNTCLEAEGFQFITGIAKETGLEYGRMLMTNKPGQKVNGKWVQLSSNALGRFEVFLLEVNSQADRRRAEFAVHTAPAISHLPSLAPMTGGSAGGLVAMSRSDAERKRALSDMSEQAGPTGANPQEGLIRKPRMLISFKLEACSAAPDTVVMQVHAIIELCKANNGDEAVCWWACIGCTCPFTNVFSGHSDEDHRRVVKASQRDVVAKAKSAQMLGSFTTLLK